MLIGCPNKTPDFDTIPYAFKMNFDLPTHTQELYPTTDRIQFLYFTRALFVVISTTQLNALYTLRRCTDKTLDLDTIQYAFKMNFDLPAHTQELYATPDRILWVFELKKTILDVWVIAINCISPMPDRLSWSNRYMAQILMRAS